jgi:hypothetical protein
MELHALRVVLLIVVTVDALAFFLERTQHIVVDHTLVVVLKATLIDGKSLVTYKRWEYETIAKIAVDAIGRHVDAEWFVVSPLVGLLGIYIYCDGAILSLLGEYAPLVNIGLGLAFAYYLLIATAVSGYHIISLLIELECKRSDVDGDGNIGIVGINLR